MLKVSIIGSDNPNNSTIFGIAIISNFNEIANRDDVGALWENFIFIERLKHRSYPFVYANMFFWRIWEQQEIVEERDGTLFGYECKWKQRNVSIPPKWAHHYPEAHFDVIHPGNSAITLGSLHSVVLAKVCPG